MRKGLRKALEIAATPFVTLTGPVYSALARTGIAVDQCRRRGFQPVALHYYQPIPDYERVGDTWFDSQHNYPGYRIDAARVGETLDSFRAFASECRWPTTAVTGYFTDNPSFGFSSAAVLHAMIRANSTQKVLEIGSGFSSWIARDALRRNGADTSLLCVEPYPTALVRELVSNSSGQVRLLEQKCQDVPISTFLELSAGDILFIDSSHVAKLESDVNFLFLEVIPRLLPGVIVHVHDIYIPYEYPRAHFFGETKMFWNEQYMLQALLTGNRSLEVLLPLYALQRDTPQLFGSVFPQYAPRQHRPSSSFWLRVANDGAGQERV